jgi:hypothetical protein
MTEEQRMEESRRMFQIFAARMFEQRVYTAYKEKVGLRQLSFVSRPLSPIQRLLTNLRVSAGCPRTTEKVLGRTRGGKSLEGGTGATEAKRKGKKERQKEVLYV